MCCGIRHRPAPVDELRAEQEQVASVFEQIPGLIDETWAMDEAAGRGISVSHFEDQTAADAWFGSDRRREFRPHTAPTGDRTPAWVPGQLAAS